MLNTKKTLVWAMIYTAKWMKRREKNWIHAKERILSAKYLRSEGEKNGEEKEEEYISCKQSSFIIANLFAFSRSLEFMLFSFSRHHCHNFCLTVNATLLFRFELYSFLCIKNISSSPFTTKRHLHKNEAHAFRIEILCHLPEISI